MKKMYFFFSFILLIVAQTNAQWTSLNVPKSNYETYQFLAISGDGKNLFSYMSDMSAKAYFVMSHDYGDTWQKYEQPKVGYSIPTAPISAETIFWEGDVLYYVSSDGAFKKSTDFGQTFTVQNTSARSLELPIQRDIDGKWYVANSGYNWVSTDKGVNWTQTTGGIYGTAYVTAANGNIISTQNNGTIGYSTNGINWQSPTVPSGLPSGSGSSLSKASDNTLLWFKFASPSKLLKSIDNGVSWQLVNATLPTNTKRMFYFGNDIIAYEILGTTYKSTDGGLTFAKLNTTKLLNSISGLITNGMSIYLFGMSDIYKYGTAETGLSAMQPNKKYAIYPNPNNGNFTIETNESSTNSIVEIYNLMGERVFNQPINNSKTAINSGLKQGIYFVKTTGNKHEKGVKIIIEK